MRSFSVEHRTLLQEKNGHISKWLLFSSSCQRLEMIFLGSSWWELVGVLGGKHLWICRNPPKTVALRSFLFLNYVIFNLRQFIWITIQVTHPVFSSVVPAPGKLMSVVLCIPLSPYFKMVVCHVTAVVWWVPEKLLIFSVFSFIPVVRIRLMTSKLFTC